MIVSGVVTLLFSCCLIGITALFEGDNCTLEATNEEGQCIRIHECEDAKKLLQQNQIPETCGFLRNIPLVCCPVKQKLVATKPGKLAQEKCMEYYRKSPFLPTTESTLKPRPPSSIYLGQKAQVKEFPHMATLGYVNSENDILWLCGGALISHYFVLSAAHCAYSIDFGSAKRIRLGDLDLANTTEDAYPLDFQISQIYVNPQYKSNSHYHDIALFKMEKSTYFGSYFKAACLQIEKNLPGQDVQAIGWGNYDIFEEESSSHLMKVNLSIVDHGTCARKYTTSRKLKRGIVDSTQVCAGNAEGGDTCPGASGGPLHYRVGFVQIMKPHFVVAGVTSFGKGCGQEDSAGVYTRVSAYIGWIENIVWRKNFE